MEVESSLSAESTDDQPVDVSSPMRELPKSITTRIPPLDSQSEQRIMQSILEIFQLDEDPETENQAWEEEETAEELEEKAQRTERLKNAYPLLQQLWWSRSELMPAVTEKLANGSRCIKWREPIGDSGILEFFLEFLNMRGVQHNLLIHILRLIGNSCADTDINRGRVVTMNHIPSVIRHLQNDLLLPFAIPVLFNVCMDYEPAQIQASEARLSKELVDLISSPRFLEIKAFLGYVCKIFDLLILQPPETDLAPENTPVILLTMATDINIQPDLEDFMALTNSAIGYLKHKRFQEYLIQNPSGLPTALAILNDSHGCFGSSHDDNSNSVSMDLESAQELWQMRSELLSVLSDVSDLPSFSITYPLSSPVTSSIIRLIAGTPSTNSIKPSPELIAACIILGNLAQTDLICQTLIHTYAIHLPLTAILSTVSRSIDSNTPSSSQATQLTYYILGLLRNLGISANNKASLGNTGILDASILPRLWSLDGSPPQFQYTAVALTRQMIIGCLSNVKRLCQPLSQDPDSPASKKSSLHLLLDLHKRSDAEPIKMEISRLVAAVCRVLHTNSSSQSTENNSTTETEQLTSLRQKFYEMHSTQLREPLAYLLVQDPAQVSNPPKHPVLRSEGWFVLALMAGTLEGSQVVEQCMHSPTLFGLACEILSGKKWEAGSAFNIGELQEKDAEALEMQEQASTAVTAEAPQSFPAGESGVGEGQQARDRSNVLVMASELLRNQGDSMAHFRKEVFEDLVKVGGKDVASTTGVLTKES